MVFHHACVHARVCVSTRGTWCESAALHMHASVCLRVTARLYATCACMRDPVCRAAMLVPGEYATKICNHQLLQSTSYLLSATGMLTYQKLLSWLEL